MKKYIYYLSGLLFLAFACKQPYEPPALKSNPDLLVVDGILLNGNDSSNLIISRTRKLTDTVKIIPEVNAEVQLVDESGPVYPLTETGKGRYSAAGLNLNIHNQYKLRIHTARGDLYESDNLPIKITPPIDSVDWKQDSTGFFIYVTTHDPSNQSRYYRYDYVESWEYHTAFESRFNYVNGVAVQRPLEDLFYYCFQSMPSTNIEVATSNRLADDVIYRFHLYSVPIASEKLGFRYSTLINQYAIDSAAFAYWTILKKNTEQLGTLFDAQPSSATQGNIHNVSNPQEIVLGFMSISTLESKRIFVNNSELRAWGYIPYYNGACGLGRVLPDSAFYYFPPGGNPFFVFIGTDIGGILIYTTVLCGDCRWHGGSNQKPPFWP